MVNTLSAGAYFIFLLCFSDLTYGQIRYSIHEELGIGAFVGNIAEDLRVSVRELTARNFQLISDNGKQYFEVNEENGILVVHNRIDREQLCMESSTCSMFLEFAVENPVEMFPVEVEILDINDNSPIFPSIRLELQVAESATPGASFPLESAHDPDVGNNTISTYKISANEHFGLKMQTTSDGSKLAELLLEKSLDREQQTTFALVLTAVDGGIPGRSGTAQIIITITDANDYVPVFDHQIYRTNVLENAPIGTLVLQLHAADLDEGANAEFKYSFSNYASQRERDLFNLNSETGEIIVKGLLDFEALDHYELDVQAVDNEPNVGHAKVLVRIVDVNDNSPEIKLKSVIKMIPEDTAPGTVVAVFAVTDRDVGENGHVRCQISINVPFKLQATLRNHYKLLTTDILDRETTAMYNITITTWDAGSPSLSTNKTIVVFVSDINDNVPRFSQSSYNVYVMENNIPGADLISVRALDPDLKENGEISFSILENEIQAVLAPSYFNINSKSGSIYALSSFDYEQVKNFQLKVQVQDAGSPPLSSTAMVRIIILDQNDNAPVIISPLIWNNSEALSIVPNSAYPGYIVCKVMANDADSGQNARLSYKLIETTDRRLFTVGLHSGEIRTTRIFTDQDTIKQRVVVSVKDNGQPSLSSTVTILFSMLSTVAENQSERIEHPSNFDDSPDLNIYLIIIFGSTSSIFLVTIIFLIAVKCKHDRNNMLFHSPTICCCCMSRKSNDIFNSGLAANQSLNYYAAGQKHPVSESYGYTVRLSPQSSKSDFLFLKACQPMVPLTDIRVSDSLR
uniref:protocadherin-10-like n=1 Tax=Pristiophorus japonicus TaxID=55135 RepID=UPI00398E666E